MHIAQVKLSNVLGISELEFTAGAFNQIAGHNEAGKTSVLEAIKAVVKGGEDATILRKGADKGEIVLLLDDGVTIRRKITPSGSTTTVEKDGVRSPEPRTVIKALTDMFSINPVDFLRLGSTPAGKKQRVSMLLEALPVQIDEAKLAELAGDAAKVANPEASALDQIDAIYKTVFDDRTGTNRAVREKEGTINQLAQTLPSEDEAGAPGDTVETLEQRLENIDVAKDAELDRISTKLDGLRTETNQVVDQLRSQIAALLEKVAAEHEKLAEVERKAGQQREISTTRYRNEREPVQTALIALRNNASAIARAAQTRDTIAQLRTEADKLADDAHGQSNTLMKLEAYKSELLASLPISGLAVVDGEILRNDVPYDRLNMAQQVEIAVEIAKLRSGQLGVICVDGIELLDSKHFETFREQALASGLQLFVTKVTDGPFEVTST